VRGRGRPAVSSRHEIERVAMALFLRDGYGGTTVPAIAAACGMSRSSFFRYFSAKSEIVWVPFDEHLRRLGELLAAPVAGGSAPVLLADRVCAALEEAVDADGVWLDRFRVLDNAPELAPEEAERWIHWAEEVSGFVVRARPGSGPVVPHAVGGAVQSTFLAVLRQWTVHGRAGVHLLPEMHRRLVAVGEALWPLVEESAR
jgi:AcrR family transcriptional regulator